MSTVKDVLDQKGRTVFSIEADKSVLEAIEVMVAEDVAALVVIDEGTAVAGIITERPNGSKSRHPGEASWRKTKQSWIGPARRID